jgi:hypothetical protein
MTRRYGVRGVIGNCEVFNHGNCRRRTGGDAVGLLATIAEDPAPIRRAAKSSNPRNAAE